MRLQEKEDHKNDASVEGLAIPVAGRTSSFPRRGHVGDREGRKKVRTPSAAEDGEEVTPSLGHD